MKKFRASLPTVLYTVLLLSIALLSFLIAGRSSAVAMPSQAPSAAKRNEESAARPEAETPPQNEVRSVVYSDSFPRINTDGKQTIYGEGNVELVDVIQTAVGNYVFVVSDCIRGDVPCEKSSLAIVRTNDNNDLLACAVLGEEETFCQARPSVAGLVVLSTNNDKTFSFVRIISYDLKEKKEYKIAVPSDARVVSTDDGFFIFASYDDECLFYVPQNDKLVFGTIEKGSFTELFEYADCYLVFCKLPTGESYALSIDKSDLSVLNRKKLTDEALLAIAPARDGANNYFITVEGKDKKTAKKYDASTLVPLDTEELGRQSILKIEAASNGLLLLTDGPVCGYVFVGSDLSPVVIDIVSTAENARIAATARTDDKYIVLFKNENDELFFAGEKPFETASEAKMLLTPKNALLVYLQKTNDDKNAYVEILTVPYEK